MDTVLWSGVTFGTPVGMPRGAAVEHNIEFELYKSAGNPFEYGMYYVVRFAQSLQGLLPGAPWSG